MAGSVTGPVSTQKWPPDTRVTGAHRSSKILYTGGTAAVPNIEVGFCELARFASATSVRDTAYQHKT